MPTISVMMKPASGLCNMKCSYCFYCDETENREVSSYGFMSEETLKNVVRRTMTRAEGAVSFAFQGGEPTLRGLDFFRYFTELTKKYSRPGLKVMKAIQTNGYALDEEWCRFLKENDFLVGVSLDGIKATHDTNRRSSSGEATFDRIEKSIALLQKYRVDFNILTVINSSTAPKISEIYEYYRKKHLNYQQYILCLDPLEKTDGTQKYSLTPEEYGSFMINLFDLWSRGVKLGHQPYIRQFENYIGILLGYQPESCDMCGKCGIQYIVEADGGVYPCDFYMLDDYCLGNFNTERIDSIDRKRKEIGFTEASEKLTDECRQCEYYFMCRGGCMRHRSPFGGAFVNDYCESYKMFFEARLDSLKELAMKISR